MSKMCDKLNFKLHILTLVSVNCYCYKMFCNNLLFDRYFLFFSCHKRFAQLDPNAVKLNKNAKISQRKILTTLPELRVSMGTLKTNYYLNCKK